MSEPDDADGGSPVREVIGAVAGCLPGGGVLRQVKVDRAALRKAVKAAHAAAGQLSERAAKARTGLDGSAHKHPDLASSPVLTSVAESWRELQVKVIADAEGFGSLVGRVTDGYDRAEEAGSAILRKVLGDL